MELAGGSSQRRPAWLGCPPRDVRNLRRDTLRARWLAGLGCLLGTSALAAVGCGSGGGGGGAGKTVKGNTLTVYSSLPLQGPTRVNSVAVNNGAKIALFEAGGRVGKYKIRFKQLDDSTAAAG